MCSFLNSQAKNRAKVSQLALSQAVCILKPARNFSVKTEQNKQRMRNGIDHSSNYSSYSPDWLPCTLFIAEELSEIYIIRWTAEFQRSRYLNTAGAVIFHERYRPKDCKVNYVQGHVIWELLYHFTKSEVRSEKSLIIFFSLKKNRKIYSAYWRKGYLLFSVTETRKRAFYKFYSSRSFSWHQILFYFLTFK